MITTSEIFDEIPKIYVSQTSQFDGDLIWLSEEKINFEYSNDIYFFADAVGNQKTEYSIINATELEGIIQGMRPYGEKGANIEFELAKFTNSSPCSNFIESGFSE